MTIQEGYEDMKHIKRMIKKPHHSKEHNIFTEGYIKGVEDSRKEIQKEVMKIIDNKISIYKNNEGFVYINVDDLKNILNKLFEGEK
jgi:hypothetical protein